MKEGTHKLGKARECREALAAAAMGDPVTIERLAGELHFFDGQSRLLGTLTTRHELAKRLSEGQVLLHCSINSVYAIDGMRPYGSVNVRVATGDAHEVYVKWEGPARPTGGGYSVGIVGESNFQEAIRECCAGDSVRLWREPDNPYDGNAIAVKTASGATIGYIARKHWLQEVVHDQGCGVAATVNAIYPGPPMGVVLAVSVTTDPLGVDSYETPRR